ncbi:hypothetical protein Tco_1416648 [Tanacetum coccineum]
MEQMLLEKKDEAGVILSNKQNDFLLADATQMEEIEELSANICMMARIQKATTDSDEGLSYYSAFISELIQILLWIVDSRCSKHMIGKLKLLKNFIEKFMRTVCFGNGHFAVTRIENTFRGDGIDKRIKDKTWLFLVRESRDSVEEKRWNIRLEEKNEMNIHTPHGEPLGYLYDNHNITMPK